MGVKITPATTVGTLGALHGWGGVGAIVLPPPAFSTFWGTAEVTKDSQRCPAEGIE